MHDQKYIKTCKRRWKMAITAIYFTRALLSLSKKVPDRKSASLMRSVSYVAMDLQPELGDSEHDKPLRFLSANTKVLREMVREKKLVVLNEFGGVKEVAASLETDMKNGITDRDAALELRKDVFGQNKFQKPPAKGVSEAFKNSSIIIVLLHGWKDGWYDGGSIIIAILLLVVLLVSNLRQSKQFEKILGNDGDRKVEVVRGGRHQTISTFDVVVGDIVCLKIGDQIPADGLFLEGHSLMADESSMNGESDHVEINGSTNPFLLSGTKVTDGFGSMLVTSVGMNTAWGEMMSSVSRKLEEGTPLQERVDKLIPAMAKVGLLAAILVLLVLLIRHFTGNIRDNTGRREFNVSKTEFDEVMKAVASIATTAVTIVVVVIPECLELAIILILVYSKKHMKGDNAMVRELSACETMGSATVICTDKTGTLTLNEMKVTEFRVGKDEISQVGDISPYLTNLLKEAVGLNTSGSVYQQQHTSLAEISGSPTEKALLSWAVLNLGMNIDEVKQSGEVVHVETFSSEKKRSGVLMREKSSMAIYTHWKGAAEMILAMCSNYHDNTGKVMALEKEERVQIETIIRSMAAKRLRCIAFASNRSIGNHGQFNEKLEETGLTLLGIVALMDPCRPEVEAAVESCKSAGVKIKMITGDNVHTARAIATECGILDPNEDSEEAVIEGFQFRNYSPEERTEKIDKICVIARSSPFDKLLMVRCLKKKGQVVAVIGDGINDAPALKEADIGLSMGIQGTEVAKESSDIVIMDDNFASIVTVLRWGRCVYNNIRKFIQFQLTASSAALVVNFVVAVSSGKAQLTAVQLLWINLILDTLGAMALATDKPSNNLMAMPPVGRSEPLITRVMWRNLIAQALYQATALLILQFKGRSIFGVNGMVKDTLIFNTFVLCQVFNLFNARKLDKKNIFEGIHENKLFIAIVGITVALQVVTVEFLIKLANAERLDWSQWVVCIGIAALSWPIGLIVKCIDPSCCAESERVN